MKSTNVTFQIHWASLVCEPHNVLFFSGIAVQPICLPKRDDEFEEGILGMTSGWGKNSESKGHQKYIFLLFACPIERNKDLFAMSNTFILCFSLPWVLTQGKFLVVFTTEKSVPKAVCTTLAAVSVSVSDQTGGRCNGGKETTGKGLSGNSNNSYVFVSLILWLLKKIRNFIKYCFVE